MKRRFVFLFALIFLWSPMSVWSAADLPEFVYFQVDTSEDSDRDVGALVKEAVQLTHEKPEEARRLYIEVLRKVKDGAQIDEYDYLSTQYGLLKSAFDRDTAEFTKRDYMQTAENVLAYLDDSTSTGIWEYTTLGEFQMEVYRSAGNGLAWHLAEESDNETQLLKALEAVDKAEQYIRGVEDYYIYDTKVRVLLKLKRQQEAYAIVKQVLDEEPGFGGFQDFSANAAYSQWRKANP